LTATVSVIQFGEYITVDGLAAAATRVEVGIRVVLRGLGGALVGELVKSDSDEQLDAHPLNYRCWFTLFCY
jgi:hypothetical protein